jgi:hypothetical protein
MHAQMVADGGVPQRKFAKPPVTASVSAALERLDPASRQTLKTPRRRYGFR